MSNIKELRERAGLTQQQAADEIGVSKTTLRRWENLSRYPSADQLINIAIAYNCSIDDIILSDDYSTKKNRSRFLGLF